MGLRHNSSNQPDWRDVAATWEALETLYDQRVVMEVNRVGSGKFASLEVTVGMVEDRREDGALKPSAFVKYRFSTNTVGAMEAALLAALYRLDFTRSELPLIMIPNEA